MTQTDCHNENGEVADQKVALATLASEPGLSAAVISMINTTTMMLPGTLPPQRFIENFWQFALATHVIHDIEHGKQVGVNGGCRC